MAVFFDLDAVVRLLGKRSVGIISTPAGWVEGRGALADAMVGELSVTGLFALEHGIRGDLQDGVHFETYTDERTGIPVYSFYGGTGYTFPTAVMETLDVVLFHAQDVSHRAYTYKQTLAATLLAAAGTRTAVVGLDRPTPLGYMGNHGPLWNQFFPEPIPVIDAFTLGELGRWLVRRRDLDVDLEVIPAGNWRRDMTWRETGLPWIPPSPNIPFVDSAVCYACTGILQHTSISEGRGCCKPYEFVGAPFADGAAISRQLNALGLPGVAFREVYFTPAFNKFAGTLCAGVHLMILDERRVDALRTSFAILRAFATHAAAGFELTRGFGRWLDGTEWDAERLRDLDVEAFLTAAESQSEAFTQSMADDLLYA